MTCKRQKIHDHTFNISEKTPKFFKIILQDAIQDGRLGISRKFVKFHGDCLSNRVIIKVADGTIWKMELMKGEKYEAWLQKGWKEFEQHYSLQHGFLLQFKYEGGSLFHVIIFDTTLLEIEYPKKPNSSPNLDKDSSFIPNLDQNPSSSPNLDQNPSSSPNLNGFIAVEDSDNKNIEIEGVSNESKGRSIYEAADKFSCSNPWFKVVLKQYRNRDLFGMVSLPVGFVREYMDCESEMVTLKIEGGKICWETKLYVSQKYHYARLGIGWSAFGKDNSLKDKDVCVFELIARNELKVHIFRHLPLNA
ncbi:B3 domain-containing protein Os11g0197600 [Euphorbia peplus]|nr:B3 domain-containing protein Os11g0197600 [Euphorbia peplus]